MGLIVRAVSLCILWVALTGCGANLYRSSAADSEAKEVSKSEFAVTRTNGNDLERLKRLWRKRSIHGAAKDFPMGPGDVLEISVPAIPELTARVVRISGEGAISLPYIGSVDAAGMTDNELEAELHQRLLKYMHNPRVFLVVREYHSRQVAVLGAVMKPGMYRLNSPSETLYDLVNRAGGVTTAANPVIQIIPAEEASKEDKAEVMAVASTLPKGRESDPATLVLKRTDPIVIDTADLENRGLQKYFYLPARPGDVVMIPGGEQVLVEGWVEKPGAYPVTGSLTVAGIVAAAGGPLYPANLERIKVIRRQKDGTKAVAIVNLEEIKSGAAEDIRLNGGDIIEVTATDTKLVGYGMYKMFSTMVSISARVPIF